MAKLNEGEGGRTVFLLQEPGIRHIPLSRRHFLGKAGAVTAAAVAAGSLGTSIALTGCGGGGGGSTAIAQSPPSPSAGQDRAQQSFKLRSDAAQAEFGVT